MAESAGLIERAAALLRESKARPAEAPREDWAEAPASLPQPLPAEAEPQGDLVLDLRQLARQGIALPSEQRSRSVEEFRLIKQNVMAGLSQGDSGVPEPRNRLVMVASPLSGEGKTFVAINLALAFASARDHHAVLMDLDTQHPLVPSIFGTSPEKGIVDVLAERASLSEVMIRTSLPGLAVLAAGAPGPEVPELFSSKRMAVLLAQLTERHPDRYVIIDTPPCLLTSEAATLAPLVGQTVFVIEANRTQRSEIEAGLNLLGGCPRVSLLLNKCDRTAGDHFGSYGSYYYSDGKSEGRRGAG
ncbi:MAG TPA: AAA family ATPase [Stellaceae bacterium]|nr:AAA family ATPase [Stellaceae bacterium]